MCVPLLSSVWCFGVFSFFLVIGMKFYELSTDKEDVEMAGSEMRCLCSRHGDFNGGSRSCSDFRITGSFRLLFLSMISSLTSPSPKRETMPS